MITVSDNEGYFEFPLMREGLWSLNLSTDVVSSYRRVGIKGRQVLVREGYLVSDIVVLVAEILKQTGQNLLSLTAWVR